MTGDECCFCLQLLTLTIKTGFGVSSLLISLILSKMLKTNEHFNLDLFFLWKLLGFKVLSSLAVLQAGLVAS